MWPDIVVVVAPKGQRSAGIGQAVEDLLVEAFVAQASVEALDVAILLRLSGVDVVPLDAVVVGTFQDGLAGEFGAIVRDYAGGFSINPNKGIEFPCHPGPGDAGIGFFHIDIAEVQTAEGKLYLFVAIDRNAKFAVVQLVETADRKTDWEFLEHLLESVPYQVIPPEFSGVQK